MKLLMPKTIDECYSVDIENGANLRQPEVSIAMRELRRRRWVQEDIQKKKGKDRPHHIYKPAMPLIELLKKF